MEVGESSDSSSSSSQTSKVLRARSAARPHWATSSGILDWRQSVTYGLDAAGDSWALMGSLVDLRHGDSLDDGSPSLPSDFFCATELVHSAPLLSYSWLDKGPHTDNVFAPLTLVALDSSGRMVIWNESGREKSICFEVACSVQLDSSTVALTCYLAPELPIHLKRPYLPPSLRRRGLDGRKNSVASANSTTELMTTRPYSVFWRDVLHDPRNVYQLIRATNRTMAACSMGESSQIG